MAYRKIQAGQVRSFCEAVFQSYGFSETDSETITDVLLTADLYGIESHGVQRLIRYAEALEEGSVRVDASLETVYETPCSAVWDGAYTMGQVAARKGMETAIEKARKTGFGAVTVRGSNHYGIAGYYTKMAAEQDMLGICMTNTEAIAIPTGGRKAMLGTSPIAVCMPADPVPFWFDVATTVVTRGKLEVFNKQEEPLPLGWAADEQGLDCSDADRVIQNITRKAGGGIFPLGGFSELTGSHKGYGLGILVELFTSIISGGTTSPHVQRSGNADTSFTFLALDYGMFGDKGEIKERMSRLLQELRESPRAEGCERIYTHGEKEWEREQYHLLHGIPVNDKTLEEMRKIGAGREVCLEEYITLE
ncbi:MAG: Ldh family oxidoreductase [Lachnospiraceae bacterium]|jgi:L-2-hydroxycarboxylate dehydrogenase (NAD+)|nr:Ldh family oxidoreductase [Lachnospiraceae bacterium]MCI8995374.1 Ldh family oxidoreductase [Lachnospiraceae bacterium]